LVIAWRRTSQITLRISIQQNDEKTEITTAGRIAGPWATELSRTWSELAPTIGARKVSIDLRDATYADARGIQVLRKIVSQTAAELITSTPWTKYLAEEVTRASATRTNEEL
jgi:anti-anti-sigma regulatory factor